MHTLYFDCSMGAAGDMICAALFELVSNQNEVLEKLNHIGLKNVVFIPEKKEQYKVTGTNMVVKINGQEEEDLIPHGSRHGHHHMTLKVIEGIVADLHVTEAIKQAVLAIYQIIAKAESAAHNCEVTEVHFHEVGAMDAIADITAACVLIQELKPKKVVATPIHVGSGTVRCAHGILPVPAPATAHILQGIPFYGGDVSGELCTPTGAALLRYFVDSFDDLPLKVDGGMVGRGIGKRDFKKANYFSAYMY